MIMLQNLTMVVGPSSSPTSDTDRCGVYGDDEDCEDESNGELDV